MAAGGKNNRRGGGNHRRGTHGACTAPLPGTVQRGDLRGVFGDGADQWPIRRYGGEHYHRAGRVLRIQPGCRGHRERDGADQREASGPHGDALTAHSGSGTVTAEALM